MIKAILKVRLVRAKRIPTLPTPTARAGKVRVKYEV